MRTLAKFLIFLIPVLTFAQWRNTGKGNVESRGTVKVTDSLTLLKAHPTVTADSILVIDANNLVKKISKNDLGITGGGGDVSIYLEDYNALSQAQKDAFNGHIVDTTEVSSSSGGAIWGNITGNIVNQTDLQNALNSKLGITAKAADASLLDGNLPSHFLDRTQHTGLQAIATVSGLQNALDGKANSSHVHSFGSLTGKPNTLSGYGITDVYTQSQTDSFLNAKANSSHNHDASDTNSGVFNIARIPTGTTGTTVALGNQSYTKAESDSNFLGINAKAADSDLFNGINSERFLVDRNINVTSQDWNSINPNSISVASNASGTNKPNGAYGYGMLTHFRGGSNDSEAQIYHTDSNSDGIYFRTKYGGNNWGNWREVWTNANDGSGSGLDADLFDGLNSTAFFRKYSSKVEGEFYTGTEKPTSSIRLNYSGLFYSRDLIADNELIGNIVKVESSTPSTTKDTGALIVENGGLGVEEDGNFGGEVIADNIDNTINTTTLTLNGVTGTPTTTATYVRTGQTITITFNFTSITANDVSAMTITGFPVAAATTHTVPLYLSTYNGNASKEIADVTGLLTGTTLNIHARAGIEEGDILQAYTADFSNGEIRGTVTYIIN